MTRRTTALIAHLQTEAAEPGSSPPAGADFDGLVAAAQVTAQQELDSLLRGLLARRLHELEHAAQRARQGRYGLCEACGASIPAERLKAVPYTTVCVSCRHQRERVRRHRAA